MSSRFQQPAEAVPQLARLRYREKVRNWNECHRLTTALIREYRLIVVEVLRVLSMTASARGTEESPGSNVQAKSGLNRSILEQSWGILLGQLAYKAEWHDRHLVIVDP